MVIATFSSLYFTIKAAFTLSQQLLAASTLDNYSHSNYYKLLLCYNYYVFVAIILQPQQLLF